MKRCILFACIEEEGLKDFAAYTFQGQKILISRYGLTDTALNIFREKGWQIVDYCEKSYRHEKIYRCANVLKSELKEYPKGKAYEILIPIRNENNIGYYDNILSIAFKLNRFSGRIFYINRHLKKTRAHWLVLKYRQLKRNWNRTIKRRCRQLMKRNTDRISFFIQTEIKKSPPLAIFTMGKVGSVSLFESLKDIYPGTVVHLHEFTHNPLERKSWLQKRLYKYITVEKKPLYIISAVREPFAREISQLFETYGNELNTISPSMERIREFFFLKAKPENTLNYFDNYIERYFKIDVFNTPFPFEKGYATFQQNGNRLLILRSETSDDQKAAAICQFLSIPPFTFKNSNIGEQKKYAKIYREFKQQVKFPLEYIEKVCSSKYFKHFYPEKTLEVIKKRWGEE